MKFLKESLLFCGLIIIMLLVLYIQTNNLSLSLVLFVPLFLISTGLTWLIHFNYINNDKMYEIIHADNTIIIKNKAEGFTVNLNHVSNIKYYRRTVFLSEKAFLEPSFSRYYYIEVINEDGNSIRLSCLEADKFIHSYNYKIEFIRKNIPFIPLGPLNPR